MRKVAALLGLALLSAGALHAKDISGTWQGASGTHRYVLKIGKAPQTGYRGDFYNLGLEAAGNARNGNPISTITLEGSTVTFTLDRSAGTFEGRLAEDGKSIAGTWQTRAPKEPLTLERATAKSAWVIDPSPHKTLFVTVDKGVTLEVLDWGGSGPPLIFLPGLGNTAHVFDDFAPKFTPTHHVYGITRRGIGLSSAPPPTDENYDADRLGDDVLAVIAALHIDHPVVAGHSIAGEQLSSIGTRHPEKVAGLIYLDANGAAAFYDNRDGSLGVDVTTVRRDLRQLPKEGESPSRSLALIQEIEATIPNLTKSLDDYAGILKGLPEYPRLQQTQQLLIGDAILANERKYADIRGPVLAIIAEPHACQPNCDNPGVEALVASDAKQNAAFEAGTPQAKVVRLPYADHYVFRSNEADVLREMNAFMDGLAKASAKTAD